MRVDSRHKKKENTMRSLEKLMTLLALLAFAISAPAFAAVTHTGTTSAKIVVVTEVNAQTTSSNSYVDLPGAAVSIVVPAGKFQLVQARFTAESYCFGPNSFNWCTVQIVAVGTAGTTQMLPDSGTDFAFDAVGTADDAWEGHAMDRSLVLGGGTYVVKAQWAVTDTASTFRLDDWSFTVTQYNAGR
jgi:hypothetical protein